MKKIFYTAFMMLMSSAVLSFYSCSKDDDSSDDNKKEENKNDDNSKSDSDETPTQPNKGDDSNSKDETNPGSDSKEEQDTPKEDEKKTVDGIMVTDKINGHYYIDLGLSVKWAASNVGASKLYDDGEPFSWGELNKKSEYEFNTYRYWDNNTESITKYNESDGNTVLGYGDDVVISKWDGTWRMPTEDEFDELINNCYWHWTRNYNDTRKTGYVGKSNINGNEIFFAAGGFYQGVVSGYPGYEDGFYWSSTLTSSNVKEAVCMTFSAYNDPEIFLNSRAAGLLVRAVSK